ncbi:hypothetical protein I215_03193 [Galbibacter marinus]|uniref:Lipoprotein n=1 Tax=Galbibacter marinus TaxID=555500 RepID=K2PUY2_9FLAO|nr:hypothetical protein [Galbibacter marinus]EKF56495.1 hypothetical protein I215_03193 [Galbibacter marinus]
MKKLVFTLASVIVLSTLNSCAHDESTAQIDSLYAVDRRKVERPGNQGQKDEPKSVDKRKVERPGNQGQNGEPQSVDKRKVERPGNQGGN